MPRLGVLTWLSRAFHCVQGQVHPHPDGGGGTAGDALPQGPQVGLHGQLILGSDCQGNVPFPPLLGPRSPGPDRQRLEHHL